MHVCGQTLVLVDNDATVSEVNQKLVKATLKYMFYHIPEDRTFCLNTYEHNISLEEQYTSESADLVCAADGLEFTAKDSSLTDTLAEVVSGWKEADFACRDIVVFSDGLEGEAVSHEKEELYYLLENSEYPVYVVMLDQENNAGAGKTLSAIAVTSGGKLFETEFEGSEAGIDRQITESVYAAMAEYADSHWSKYEEDSEKNSKEQPDGKTQPEEPATDESTSDETSEKVSEKEGPEDEYMQETSVEEKVLYEPEDTGFFSGTGALILSAIFIAAGLIAGIGGGFIIMKKKRAGRKNVVQAPVAEEEFFDDYELKGFATTDLAGGDEGDTVFLGSAGDGDATRLLTSDAMMVTLTDTDDSSRIYRIVASSSMSVGRGNCDVMITGDDALSKRHCELFERDRKVYVKDLASSNGTRVNGVRITQTELKEGDMLAIGSRTYRVAVT